MKEESAQFHFVPAEIYPWGSPIESLWSTQKASATAKQQGGVFVRPRPIEGDMLMLLDDDHAYVPHAIGEDLLDAVP